jgi:CRP-like cAMP-binding protein
MDEFSSIRKFISQFIAFTEDEWQPHQSALVRRWIKKGDYLLHAGQVCNHVSFINTGCFRVFHEHQQAEFTTYFAFENEYVTDYSSFLTRKPSLDNIVALEDAEVLQLGYDHMQKFYEQYPVWQKFGRLIAEHIFLMLAERSKDLQRKTPEELYLLMMNSQVKILDRVPLKYIASYLGITPEALSRIRKRIASSKPVSSHPK